MGKVLVIVLDGMSFVFLNTFKWFMASADFFWSNAKRRLMYIDDVPITPTVLCTMFTGRYSDEHGVKGFRTLDKPGAVLGECRLPFVWNIAAARGFRVKVMNVPVKIPTVWINTSTYGHDWVDLWLPPRDQFSRYIALLHSIVKRNLDEGKWDLAIVWYPVPDQAHHHFFPAITNERLLRIACQWYDYALSLARDLIETYRPRYWLVVSDHGFSSDFEEYYFEGVKQHVHVRDGVAMANTEFVPTKPVEVFHWICRYLGLSLS